MPALERVSRPLLVLVVAAAVLVVPRAPADAAERRPTHAQPVLSHASAARFFHETLEEKLRGDWARAWASLYPFHQRVASREAFVRCEALTRFAAPLQGLRIAGVRDAAVGVPGRRTRIAGVAVDVVVELRWYGPRDPIVFRHAFHLVPVHGRWRWLLSPSRYLLYAHGACAPGERGTAGAGSNGHLAER